MISAQEAYKQTMEARIRDKFWGSLEQSVMDAIEKGDSNLTIALPLNSEFARFLMNRKTEDDISALGYNFEYERDIICCDDKSFRFKLNWES